MNNPGITARILTPLLLLTAGLGLSAGVLAQTASKRAPQLSLKGAESCLFCHSDEKIQAVQDGPHRSAPDSRMGTQGCESCHGPGSFHVSRAHGGAGFPPLIEFGRRSSAAPREAQLEACLHCHREKVGDSEAIVFLGSPHDITRINCSTCHESHTARDPILIDMQAEDRNCNRCHRRIRAEHKRFEERGIDFDSLACSACHDVHSPDIEESAELE
jgi:DmsE family decaheme c-type cytochrome